MPPRGWTGGARSGGCNDGGRDVIPLASLASPGGGPVVRGAGDVTTAGGRSFRPGAAHPGVGCSAVCHVQRARPRHDSALRVAPTTGRQPPKRALGHPGLPRCRSVLDAKVNPVRPRGGSGRYRLDGENDSRAKRLTAAEAAAVVAAAVRPRLGDAARQNGAFERPSARASPQGAASPASSTALGARFAQDAVNRWPP